MLPEETKNKIIDRMWRHPLQVIALGAIMYNQDKAGHKPIQWDKAISWDRSGQHRLIVDPRLREKTLSDLERHGLIEAHPEWGWRATRTGRAVMLLVAEGKSPPPRRPSITRGRRPTKKKAKKKAAKKNPGRMPARFMRL